MALDFAQIGIDGTVTGFTVRISPRTHGSVIACLMASEYPLLSRMREYYDDVEYQMGELAALGDELRRRLIEPLLIEDQTIVEQMLELVRDSTDKELTVEAIAD
jgi:hypothetical protein